MASTIPHRHHHLFRHFSFPSLSTSNSFPSQPNTTFPFPLLRPIKCSLSFSNTTSSTSTSSFTWDDVFRVSQLEHQAAADSSDLSGFFEKIQSCNRGSEMQSVFIPFIIEHQTVGYVHSDFVDHLRRFRDVFVLHKNQSYLSLDERLRTPEDSTRVVGEVIKCLGEEELIPGIRNELYPVLSSFGSPVYFSLERAAAPYFGIKAYGVLMNGFVERDGEKFLWIGKRSEGKQTYPGMLDHLVAGGLPHGISCGENIVKECEEEAGIPESISKAIPVGAISYIDIEGYRYKGDVLFCYDLKLPGGFIPKNQGQAIEPFLVLSFMEKWRVLS